MSASASSGARDTAQNVASNQELQTEPPSCYYPEGSLRHLDERFVEDLGNALTHTDTLRMLSAKVPRDACRNSSEENFIDVVARNMESTLSRLPVGPRLSEDTLSLADVVHSLGFDVDAQGCEQLHRELNLGFEAMQECAARGESEACDDETMLRDIIGECEATTWLTNETLRAAVDLWFDDRDRAIRQHGDISKWDVSDVTDISKLFEDRAGFNEPIGEWNTMNVISMVSTFKGASSFNQPIGEWNTANVISMASMFKGASSFNQPIGEWNTGAVNDSLSDQS